jgi:hypothetical protein
MSAARPRRRWLQFSLRSLLLLTLVIAGWLGFEAREASFVERTAAAIRKAGGQVEFESKGWSLLRFVAPQRYGLRIVRAEIPAGGADESAKLLSRVSDLHEVVVLFDGTCEPNAVMTRVRQTLPSVMAVAKAAPIETFANVASADDDRLGKLKARLLPILRCGPAFRGQRAPRNWQRWELWWSDDERGLKPTTLRSDYRIVGQPDGSLAEIFALNYESFVVPSLDRAIVVLIRADRALTWTAVEMNNRFDGYTLVVDDIDGDGLPDVGLECESSASAPNGPAVQFSGDPRFWLELYRIDGDQFRSLLPRREPELEDGIGRRN